MFCTRLRTPLHFRKVTESYFWIVQNVPSQWSPQTCFFKLKNFHVLKVIPFLNNKTIILLFCVMPISIFITHPRFLLFHRTVYTSQRNLAVYHFQSQFHNNLVTHASPWNDAPKVKKSSHWQTTIQAKIIQGLNSKFVLVSVMYKVRGWGSHAAPAQNYFKLMSVFCA